MRVGARIGRKRKRGASLVTAAAAAGIAVPLATLRAEDIHWIAGDAEWNQIAAWLEGKVPAAGDTGVIANSTPGSVARVKFVCPSAQGVRVQNDNVLSIEPGGDLSTTGGADIGLGTRGTVNQTGGRYHTGGWSVHGVDGGFGSYNQSGGIRTVGGNNYLGWNAASIIAAGTRGQYNLSGGEFEVLGDQGIGVNGADGTFTQTGGAARTGWNRPGWNQDNFPNTHSTGRYNMHGGSLDVHGSTAIGVGRANTVNATASGQFLMGDGSVRMIKQGSDLLSGNLYVGFDGGVGRYEQTGGTVESYRSEIGTRNGARGTAVQTGGTNSTLGWMFIGAGAGSDGDYSIGALLDAAGGNAAASGNVGGNPVLNVGGGDADTTDDDLFVGAFGATGRLTIAGNAAVNVARDVRIGDSGNGRGTVVQTGGSFTVGRNLFFGVFAGSYGEYNLQGGTLDMTGGFIDQGNGAGSFSMTGGLLKNVADLFIIFNQQGGTLAPGGSVGTMNINGNSVGSYTLGASATLEMEIDSLTSFDLLNVNGGGLTFAGNLDLVPAPGLNVGDSFVIVANDLVDPIAGNFLGKPDEAVFFEDGYFWRIDYQGGTGNDVAVTVVVPEPVWLGGSGALTCTWLLRRRRGCRA
jgi:hypothetical protein